MPHPFFTNPGKGGGLQPGHGGTFPGVGQTKKEGKGGNGNGTVVLGGNRYRETREEEAELTKKKGQVMVNLRSAVAKVYGIQEDDVS